MNSSQSLSSKEIFGKYVFSLGKILYENKLTNFSSLKLDFNIVTAMQYNKSNLKFFWAAHAQFTRSQLTMKILLSNQAKYQF